MENGRNITVYGIPMKDIRIADLYPLSAVCLITWLFVGGKINEGEAG